MLHHAILDAAAGSFASNTRAPKAGAVVRRVAGFCRFDVRADALGRQHRLAGGSAGVGGRVCWAISAIIAKRLREQHQIETLDLTFWQLLFGLLPLRSPGYGHNRMCSGIRPSG